MSRDSANSEQSGDDLGSVGFLLQGSEENKQAKNKGLVGPIDVEGSKTRENSVQDM